MTTIEMETPYPDGTVAWVLPPWHTEALLLLRRDEVWIARREGHSKWSNDEVEVVEVVWPVAHPLTVTARSVA